MSKYQPGVRISEYVLEQCIGAGTFGEVWQARHHVWSDDRVAVKLPTEPEYVRYLQREGVVVHGIRHPNIVRVIGLDPFAETPYLVMELVKGPPLSAMLKDFSKGLPIDTALLVLRGVLRGLSAAHEGNVVHRDLKPGNVLLNLDGRPLAELGLDDVKVGDFGLGFSNADTLRSMVEQSASLERDQQGSAIAGTLAYMAPELRDGAHAPSPRSDLFSLGVMLFEMLTGERPAGAELPSTLRADTPLGMDDIFRRLYARYDNRYENVTAVLQDLDRMIAPRGRPGRDGIGSVSRDGTGSAGRDPYGRTGSRDGYGPNVGAVSPRGAHLVVCPDCRQTVEPDDQFCTQCGAQLAREVRRCPSCGGYPGPEDRFCIFCGTALTSAV